MEIIQMIDHVFWEAKSKFLLEEDQDSFWVAYLILEGSCKFEFDNSSGIANGGQILICPPNTNFKREVISPLTFHFFRLDLVSPKSYLSLESGLWTLNNLRMTANEKILRQYVYDLSSRSYFIREHMFQDLLLFKKMETYHPEQTDDLFPTHNSRIIKILNYIHEHYQEDIKISEISNKFYFSSAHFSRIFKKEIGISPKEYLLLHRLKNVQKLLISTTLSLENIAELTGFKYGYCLSRSFKKKFNISPNSFRKKHRL